MFPQSCHSLAIGSPIFSDTHTHMAMAQNWDSYPHLQNIYSMVFSQLGTHGPTLGCTIFGKPVRRGFVSSKDWHVWHMLYNPMIVIPQFMMKHGFCLGNFPIRTCHRPDFDTSNLAVFSICWSRGVGTTLWRTIQALDPGTPGTGEVENEKILQLWPQLPQLWMSVTHEGMTTPLGF